MGNLLTNLLTGGIQNMAETAKGIIEEFHMSPEQKAEQLAKVQAAQAQAQQAALDYDAKMNDIAGQNIRAEEQSGSPYTRNARPSLIYVGLIAIVWDYCVLPTITILHATKGTLPAVLLPDWFWQTWGIAVTGYVMARGLEKISAMPGDSNVSIAGGLIKVGQKSPS